MAIPDFRIPTNQQRVDLPYKFTDDGVEIEVRSANRMTEAERRIWEIDATKDWYSVYVVLKETQGRSKLFQKPPIQLVEANGNPRFPEYYFATELGSERSLFSVQANERRELKAVFDINDMKFPLRLRLTEGVYVVKDE